MAWVTPSTRAAGDTISAAIWNQDVVNNVNYIYDKLLRVRPACVVRRGSDLSLVQGTTIINWPQALVNNFGGWSSGDPQVINVTEIGWYFVWASLHVSAGVNTLAYVDTDNSAQLMWSANAAQGAVDDGHSLAGAFVLGPTGSQAVRVKITASAAGEVLKGDSTFGVIYLWD